MTFVFCNEAGESNLHVKGELFKYLIKVRRHNIGDEVCLRTENETSVLYIYMIKDIRGREAILELKSSSTRLVKAHKNLHVIWCLIDPKSIEKVLPTLNEIGVAKISFVKCERSQNNFGLDFERFRRILINSMQQCGRSEFMEFEYIESLEEVLQRYKSVVYFDFCDNVLDESDTIDTFLVGCEGGFSSNERILLQNQKAFRLKTPMILRSESAVCTVSSKILF
ncbi:MAG: 16S rRNA (uracil(1498)-N(3))-methyltransferase [Campylobacterota bacterium]|nr:16S rRNA (uracil(1498)-N(3))-methyltransferase [Campylobacterota bacterium]